MMTANRVKCIVKVVLESLSGASRVRIGNSVQGLHNVQEGSVSHPSTGVASKQNDEKYWANSPDGGVFVAAQGIALLLFRYGASMVVVRDFLHQFVPYHIDLTAEQFIAVMKYFYAFPCARLLSDGDRDLPPKPKKAWTWKGTFAKWFWERIRPGNYNNQNISFVSSFLMCKRATATVGPEFLQTCYEKHRDILSKRRECFDDRIVCLDGKAYTVRAAAMKLLQPTLDEVRKKVNEGYMEAYRQIGKTNPSASASFEWGRSKGGQYARVMASSGYSIPLGLRNCYEFVGMREDRNVVVDGKFVPRVVESLYETAYHIMEDVRDRTLRFAISRCNIGEPLRCKIQGVLEPLKVRIISKGESYPYYFSKPLQKLLHGILRNMPCFRAIGRILNISDIIDVMKVKDRLGECQNFSIDYSSATDGQDIEYSRLILNEIIRDLPEDHQKVYQSVLGKHELVYPKNTGLKNLLMENGQLMGSILSFPILCLANLGVYLLVRSHVRTSSPDIWPDMGPDFKWPDCVCDTTKTQYTCSSSAIKGWVFDKVLINGDDMVYAAPADKWDVQNAFSRAVGFEPSLGKAYRHHEFLIINSTSYTYNQTREDPSPRVHPYLPVGLLLNRRKVSGDTELGQKSPDFSPGVLNRILGGCRNEAEKRWALSFCLRRYKEDLQSKCANANLFIHPSLGGCGVELPLGWKFIVTPDQNQFAANILAQKHTVPDVRPSLHVIAQDQRDVINDPYLSTSIFRNDELLDRGLTGFTSVSEFEPCEDFGVKPKRIPRLKITSPKVSMKTLIRGCFVSGFKGKHYP